ncbi:MAG: hypothetical protein FWE82_10010, partial [Defluviitaleaceae bacterium]|nr:hypothetical protein [Defluviitaleaceae bacterium]
MPHSVNVSVRNMVEFILRSGSIDAQFFRASRAPEGIKTHQRVQKLRKKEANLSSAVYKSEVQLKITVLHRDILFTVDGRADGIFTDGNSIVVEEIKSTLSPPRTFEKNTDHWHWAQAKCYGYMYVESLRENVQKSGNVFTNEEGVASPAPPDEITIAIIYAHIET